MIISIRNKKRNAKVGHLTFNGGDGFTLNCSIQRRPKFFNELQELLMKHFNVKIISNGMNITNKLIIQELKDEYNNRDKRNTGRGRGSRITTCIKEGLRFKTDKKYRERKMKNDLRWKKEHREEMNKKKQEMTKILNEFKNKRCKDCKKLLNHRTKGEYCKNCFPKHLK